MSARERPYTQEMVMIHRVFRRDITGIIDRENPARWCGRGIGQPQTPTTDR
jgi:hypothetical protein